MKWKKTVNWLLCFMMAFNTMLSDVTVYAEEVTDAEETEISADEETENVLESDDTEAVIITEEPEQESDIVASYESQNNSEVIEATGESAGSDQIEAKIPADLERDDFSVFTDNGEEELSELQEADVEVTDVSNFTYTLSGGTVEIKQYTGSDTEVIIPGEIDGYPVTTIGNEAFRNCRSLTKITIPDSVTKIGNYTFINCSSITSFTIPEGVTYIGYDAFSGCSSLTDITIPHTVTFIGTIFYNDIYNLKTVHYDGTKEEWINLIHEDFSNYLGKAEVINSNGEYLVNEPSLMTFSFDMADKVYSVTDCDEAATELIIPAERNGYPVISIANNAFANCNSITSITIPDSVTSIGSKAFYYCSNLSSITMSENITSIGNDAFQNCYKLASIKIPVSVKTIGTDAFLNCSSLKTVYYDGTKEYWVTLIDEDFSSALGMAEVINSSGDYLFNEPSELDFSFNKTDKTYSVSRKDESLTNIVIPAERNGYPVTSIGFAAFYECTNLTSITIPDSVTSISGSAFKGCTNLLSIKIPEGVTTINDETFYRCDNLTSITIPDTVTSLGTNAFFLCYKLSTVYYGGTREEWVTLLQEDFANEIGRAAVINNKGEYIFNEPSEIHFGYNKTDKVYYVIGCDNTVTELVIPAERNKYPVTSIKDSAFSGYSNLTSVIIPEGITKIGDSAFYNCTSVEKIEIPFTISEIGESAFKQCTELKNVLMPDKPVSDTITIGKFAFSSCSSLSSITIPEGVTELADGSVEKSDTVKDGFFYGCSNLMSVSLPSTLTRIGDCAFTDCISLTSIVIPENVTDIGKFAFVNCTGLQTVNIPDSVKSIGESAFRKCQSLTSIHLPEDITSIAASTFRGCSNLSEVLYSSNLREIGDYAFSGCVNYVEILSLETLTSVGSSAFAHTGLQGVFIYGNPTIGASAFGNCENLKTVLIDNSQINLSGLFSGCKNIKNIYYAGSEEDFVSMGGSSVHLYKIVFDPDNFLCPAAEKAVETGDLGYFLGEHETIPYYISHYKYDRESKTCTYDKISENYHTLEKDWDVNAVFNIDASSADIQKGDIVLSSNTIYMNHLNESKILSARLIGDAKGKTLVFTSSNEGVVSFTGVKSGNSRTLIANGPGTAIITVTTEDGKYSASAEVTVIDSEKKYGRLTNINLSSKTMTIDGQAIPYSQLDESLEQRISTVYQGDYHCNSLIAYYIYEGNVVDFRYLDEEVGEIFDWDPSTRKLTVRIHHPGTTPEWTKEEYYVDEETAVYIESILSDGNSPRIKVYTDEEGRGDKELIQLSVIRTRAGTIDSVSEENGNYYVTVFLHDGYSALADQETFQVRDSSIYAKLNGKEGETIVFTTEDAVINEVYTRSDFNMEPSVYLDVKDNRIMYDSNHKIKNTFNTTATVSVSYSYTLPSGFEGDFSTIEDAFSITLSSVVLSSENEDLFSFGENKTKTFMFEDAADQVITLKQPLTFSTEVYFNKNYEFGQDESESNEHITVAVEFSGGKQVSKDKTIVFYKLIPVDPEILDTAKEIVDVIEVSSINSNGLSGYVSKETYQAFETWLLIMMDMAIDPEIPFETKNVVFDRYKKVKISNCYNIEWAKTITLEVIKKNGKKIEPKEVSFTIEGYINKYGYPDEVKIDFENGIVNVPSDFSDLGSLTQIYFTCSDKSIVAGRNLLEVNLRGELGKFNLGVKNILNQAKKKIAHLGLDDIFGAIDNIIEQCGFNTFEESIVADVVKRYIYVKAEHLAVGEKKKFLELIAEAWGGDYLWKTGNKIIKHYMKTKINCPVDVYVYSGDVLVGAVVNNQVIPNSNSWGPVVETEGETKYILDYGYDLTYRIVGYDEGKMDIETYIYQNNGTGGEIEPIKEIGYYDLEVFKDIEYTGEIKADSDPLTEEKLICVSNEETIDPDVDTSKGDILVHSIALDRNNLELMKDDTAMLTAAVLPENAKNKQYTWTSNNEKVATVDENGTVTAHRKGSAVIIATTANGSFTAECKVNVKVTIDDQGEILEADIPADGIVPSGLWVSGIPSKNTYSGGKHIFDFRVYDSNQLLVEGTDYTVVYKNNINAYTLKEGEAGFSAKKAPQIIIKAKGNYSGTKTVYFTIDPIDITSTDIETLTTSYTGKVQKLSPTVLYEGKTLKNGTDYTLTYPSEGYKESGIYKILVRGKGNYTGSRQYEIVIGSKALINLPKTTVSFDQKSYSYNGGKQITPVITVKNGKTIVDPVLYTVTYGENNTVGTGTVTITGDNKETIGTRTVTFKITGKPITTKLITMTVPKSVTRGTVLEDAVTITTALTEGTDYQIEYPETENAGKVNIIITGINGYTGTIKKTVTVSPDKLTAGNTVIDVPETVMMMKNGAKPNVTVSVNKTELTEGTDYTLSYANNKKAGTGTVTVKGKGNYSGSLKQTFTISAKDLSQTTLVFTNNVSSSAKKGSYKTTVVIRDEDGGVLKANTDYTLKFYDGETEIPATASANDYLGKTLTVKASGKGNYTGEEVLSAEYTVVESTLNLAKASISIKPQQYQSGKPVEITSQEQFSKAAMGKKTLTLGTDFEVYSYSNNTAKGTATVVFKGIGDYSGYKSVTYKIGQRSIKDYWSGVVSFFSGLMK